MAGVPGQGALALVGVSAGLAEESRLELGPKKWEFCRWRKGHGRSRPQGARVAGRGAGRVREWGEASGWPWPGWPWVGSTGLRGHGGIAVLSRR